MAAAGMYTLDSRFWEFGSAEDQRLDIAVGGRPSSEAGSSVC
jgi:hypothetical protein